MVAFLRIAGALAESDVFKRHHPKGRLIRLRSVDARERLFAQQMAIDGLIVVDNEELVLAINAIALDLLGVEAIAQVIGQTLEYTLGTSLSSIFMAQTKGQVEVEVTTTMGAKLLIEPGLEADGLNGGLRSTSLKDRVADSFALARARAMELRTQKLSLSRWRLLKVRLVGAMRLWILCLKNGGLARAQNSGVGDW